MKPGVKCDTLCEDLTIGADGCQEVPFHGKVMKRRDVNENDDKRTLSERHKADNEDGAEKRRYDSVFGPFFAFALALLFVML